MAMEKINKMFPPNSVEREVANMIATSHEYKTPNEDGAIKLVGNYKWEKKMMKINKLQGINKPVNKEKVFNIAKTIKPGNIKPFMVVDKFQGITPQTPGSKILLDGHHRKEACEFKGIKEVPVYYGRYTGGTEKSVQELIEKKAEEIVADVIANSGSAFYHASPVQGIKKFRLGEDTSGNNKGKVLFASKYPSFSAAFGLKWNDGNARLDVLTKDNNVPKKGNYAGSRLEYTDSVNLDKPCSMYKIKGKFEPLRYNDDLEVITKDKDSIQIISEERFNSFYDMAKTYGLQLKKVSEPHIMNKLKGSKTSNFEKKAYYKEQIEKKAYYKERIEKKAYYKEQIEKEAIFKGGKFINEAIKKGVKENINKENIIQTGIDQALEFPIPLLSMHQNQIEDAKTAIKTSLNCTAPKVDILAKKLKNRKGIASKVLGGGLKATANFIYDYI